MIHYHGTPITPREVLYRLAGRHFCVSFAAPQNVRTCREIGQSLCLDNGAFSAWRSGYQPDWAGFYAWAERWLGPADFAVIPDVIDSDAAANDALLKQWPHGHWGAPVWHLHESIGRLLWLVDTWPRVCLGSSGDYAQIGTERWERRMDAAFNALCRGRRFTPYLHGLRMLSLAGKRWPLASVDSTDIARNHNRPHNEAAAMAVRWDAMQSPHRWTERPEQIEMEAA